MFFGRLTLCSAAQMERAREFSDDSQSSFTVVATRRGERIARAAQAARELVFYCPTGVLDTSLVGPHTLGGAQDEHEGLAGQTLPRSRVSLARLGRRSGRLNRLWGEPSCGFTESLRCLFGGSRKEGASETRERSARGPDRDRSRQAERGDLLARGSKRLPVCVRRCRRCRALSPAVKRGGAPGRL